MKTNRLVSLFAILVSMPILQGCNQEEILLESSQDSQSSAKMMTMINSIYSKLHPDTRSDANNFHITNVETKSYDINNDSETRNDKMLGNSSFDIHTVSIDFGESKGYVILSDTPGIDHIFYYTEAGCINDTATIAPLKEMIESAPLIAETIAKNGYVKSYSETRGDLMIGPLVRFQWDQYYPFNYYATYCTCEQCHAMNDHMPAGCVPVALAQTIATLKHFKGTFYGNRDIDFDSFPSVASQYENINMVLSLAHFLQEIAINCQIKYECGGSHSNLYSATNYLRDLGYDADIKEGSLDKSRYIKYLQRGFPHIMGGHNEKKGHAWILDGAMESNGSLQYHINWGFGYTTSNGWSSECYYGYYFDGKDMVYKNYYKKHTHLYITLPY
ncbi:MAG: C10 family peptidase [Muribaculaceae bacterium]|nr:C10 family peptidase [Muribaculaceae bacterium]